MEDILIEKIKEKMKDRKFKADAFIREVNSEYGKKLLKMFVDTKAVNCDFRVMSGSEYSEFFCELVSTPQRIILRPDLHDEKKISIQIFDAYRDLRISDLNRLGYHMMPTDMETIKKYGMLDFVKVVNVEDLERELLAYLKRLESALREKVFKRKNKIFFNLPNEETEGSWLDARLQSQGSSKILKLASELPFFHCDLNPISSDVDFECRFGLTDTVILEKIKNIEKIRIAILSANRTLSVKKLIDLGYRPFDYHERRVFVEGKDGDFEKMVDPETLEKELLEYAKEIEGWAKENDHYVFKFDTDLRIFLDYLEEELE